jgi:molybdopterin-guanine dinucleotide biosynthesis protein A
MPRAAGVVLAGGYSTRYGGRDKALATVDGTPMLRRVVERVGRVADTVVVNCRADQRAPFAEALAASDASVAFALDPVDDAGPLAGLQTGLATVDTPVTVVLACDMPYVDPDFLTAMVERLDGREAVVPAPEGYRQPTQSVLRTNAARTAVDDALGADESSLQAVFDRLDAVELGDETLRALEVAESLRDVNQPGDLK